MLFLRTTIYHLTTNLPLILLYRPQSSAMSKVFITGATGYIGGTVLQQITAAYPSLKVTALVRDPEKAPKVTTAYPNVTIVVGDLDSTEILETQSELADVVIHTADCDHLGAASAIIRGLEKRGGGYLIHTSGIALLLDKPNGSTLSEKIWDDIKDLEELSSFPDTAIHRPAEKIILAAPPSVHTAIISPGRVHGRGSGPGNIFTFPLFHDAFISAGVNFKVGSGASTMSAIHVQDLAQMYLLLLREALKPNGGAAQWDAEGYYFGVAQDEISIGEYAAILGKALAAVGKVGSSKVETWPLEKVKEMHPFYQFAFGSNARARASRANALGWSASERHVAETIAEDIKAQFKLV